MEQIISKDPTRGYSLFGMVGKSGVSRRLAWIAVAVAVLGFVASSQAQAVPPVIEGGAAVNLAVGVTTLPGNLATNGGAPTMVCTYWGEADGGTHAAAWEHVVTNGVLEAGAFSTNIAGLVYGVLYHFRSSAQNEAGTAWASATRSFTSASPFGMQGPDVGWAHQAWTGDATSGVSSEGAKTCAVDFNGPGTTINDVVFDAHSGTTASGAGWTMGGAAQPYPNDSNALTSGGGGSATLARNFIYAGKPRTFTITGLTPGARYQTTFFSVGWEAAGQRVQTFDARGAGAVIDQDGYGNDAGIAITYCFDADATGSMDYTITPQTDNSFHVYGLVNRAVGKSVIPIAASPATAITATAATLNATLNCTGAVFEVRAYWGPSDGGADEGGWANWASVGVCTNLTDAPLACPVSGLPPGSVCFFTFQAVNAATNHWSAESLSFHTPGLPQVAIAAADQVTDVAARLNGALDVVGDAFVYFTWGESGGALSNTNVVGTIASGSFSAEISSLQAGISYDCQAWATNAYGSAQSSVANFTTLSAPLSVWESVASGSWTDPATWGVSIAPKAGGTVNVNAGHVVALDSSTPALAAVAVNGTLSFSNWNTTLNATNVTVASGGVLMPSAAFTASTMSNNVVVVCSNLVIATGGKIDASAKGYAAKGGAGNGPGYGADIGQGWGGGAGHGGHAFKLQSGGAISYGSIIEPVTAGSSGYGQNTPHSPGGGVVRIEADGTVAVDGMIAADAGATTSTTGGGAGGSVYIVCRTLVGSNGKILARGATANASTSNGNGAGGRVALHYDSAAQATVSPAPTLQISAAPGTGKGREADAGSIWLPDAYFLSETLTANLSGQIYGIASWSTASLTIDNTWVRFAEPGFKLNVAGDVTVNGTLGRLEVGGNKPVQTWGVNMLVSEGAAPEFTVGGDFAINSGSTLSVFATAAGAAFPTGAVVNVAGDLTLAANARVFPHSHHTNGASVLFRARSVSIAAGAKFDASLAGYAGGGKANEKGFGPGGGDFDPSFQYACGGGHGGYGGRNYKSMPGGAVYGVARDTATAGSGGGCQNNGKHGGRGGGVVWIAASGDILHDGSLIADGESLSWSGDYQNGAGAGGSINLSCRSISGTGSLNARGGKTSDANSSGGGGGRVSLAYNASVQDAMPVPSLAISTAPGDTGRKMGDIGTIWMSSGRLLASPVSYTGEMTAEGFTSWSVPSLRVNNCWFRLPETAVTVAGPLLATGTDVSLHRFEGFRIVCDTAVASNAALGVIGRVEEPAFTCSSILANKGVIVFNAQNATGGTFLVNGSVKLENLANLATYGGLDPSPTSVVVRVAGTLELDATSSVHPWSHPTSGGSATFFMRKLIVPAGAQINADARGYRGGIGVRSSGFGPGKGDAFPNQQATGGGHGGRGGGCSGNQPNPGGAVYGNEQAPDQPGSGGGYGYGNIGKSGGHGGGLVRIEANTIFLDGTISANGGNGTENTAGGGAGGGIHLRCAKLEGAGGVIRANGGNYGGGSDGGGGGGRIAVWRQTGDPADFTCTVARGLSYSTDSRIINAVGTVYWRQTHEIGTVLVVR